ncbi:MAG: ABC transporter ATP-binding protein [Candidatus Electrothrix sp. AR3]|nr:ABC transporter ATP-binding protein [Candidatus Electrothrix sp. AR3]
MLQGVVANLSGLYSNKLFLNNLFEFLELKPNIRSAAQPVPFPQQIQEGITFENVSFTYPGSDRPTFDGLSFAARPGEVTFVSGVNGAGKTTMIKLLCRLYDCTEGAIYIDGVNIRDFDVRVLRKNISVMFQDFVQYDFTVSENIGLGDVENGTRSERLQEAVRLSSADTVIENLPQGYDTLLGKYFENGEELSMGQWQRIALARTLYADAQVLVLDEPTSWMDAEAEAHFYQQLEQIKKGKIMLLIQHNTSVEEFSLSEMQFVTLTDRQTAER